ncbi:MAG: hypothetical protein QFX32_04220 [Methanolinea sp.]|nr:hypothetical protein [Methanolinea sp.]
MESINYDNKIEKIILIFFSNLLTIAIILAFLFPAKNYEISIYENLPFFSLFIFIIVPILITIILIYLIFNKNIPFILFCSFLFLLVLNRLIVQWLPFIRGYYTITGDHISQIGICKDIIQYGFFGKDNFYPITHILLSITNLISDISIIDLGNYSTGIISGLFLLWIYILSKKITNDKKIQYLCLIFASITFFSRYELYLMPNGWSIFFIPYILYLFYIYFIEKQKNFKIPFLLSLLIIPYFHPLTALYLIILFILIGIILILIDYILNKYDFSIILNDFPKTPIIVLSISFFSWILSFNVFYDNIRSFINALSGGDIPTFFDRVNIGISKLNLDIFDFILFLIREVGQTFIYIILSLISFCILIKSKDYFKSYKFLFILFIISGFTIFLYFSTVFNLLPGLSTIAGQRLIAYMSIFMPIFVGYGFLNISNNIFDKFIKIGFIILILSSSILSILSFHPSPHVLTPGAHVTKKEIDTAEWIFIKKDNNVSIFSILYPIKRLSHIIFGYETGKKLNPDFHQIPDHFNLSELKTDLYFSQSKGYLLISSIDYQTYTTVWAPVNRFKKEDFAKLYLNPLINKIYFNGESNMVYLMRYGKTNIID